MQAYKRFYLLTMIVLGSITSIFAQDGSDVFKKHHNLYISFGAGSSILRQFPSDVYFDGSNNLQLGVLYERAFHQRFSVMAGIEFEQVRYNFDGAVQPNSDAGFDIVEAAPGTKYTGIRQRNIALPLQGRFYFLDNIASDSRNMFLQGGIRLTQSLDFTGAEGLETSYYYREDGARESISLTDHTNQTSVQLELMVGFKGQFFRNFDLLNASTLGFMYQFNPMFDDNSTEIYPLHFTWRFLF